MNNAKQQILDEILNIDNIKDESSFDTTISMMNAMSKASSILVEYDYDYSICEMFSIFQEADEEKPDFSKMSDEEKKAYKEKHPFEMGSVGKNILWFIPNLIGLIIRSIKKCFEKPAPEPSMAEKLGDAIKNAPNNVKEFFKGVAQNISDKLAGGDGGEMPGLTIFGVSIPGAAITALLSFGAGYVTKARDDIKAFVADLVSKTKQNITHKYRFKADFDENNGKLTITTSVNFDGLNKACDKIIDFTKTFDKTLEQAARESDISDLTKQLKDQVNEYRVNCVDVFSQKNDQSDHDRDAIEFINEMRTYKERLRVIETNLEACNKKANNAKYTDILKQEYPDEKRKNIKKCLVEINSIFKEVGESVNRLVGIYGDIEQDTIKTMNGWTGFLGNIKEKLTKEANLTDGIKKTLLDKLSNKDELTDQATAAANAAADLNNVGIYTGADGNRYAECDDSHVYAVRTKGSNAIAEGDFGNHEFFTRDAVGGRFVKIESYADYTNALKEKDIFEKVGLTDQNKKPEATPSPAPAPTGSNQIKEPDTSTYSDKFAYLDAEHSDEINVNGTNEQVVQFDPDTIDPDVFNKFLSDTTGYYGDPFKLYLWNPISNTYGTVQSNLEDCKQLKKSNGGFKFYFGESSLTEAEVHEIIQEQATISKWYSL